MINEPEYEVDYRVDKSALKSFVETVVTEVQGISIKHGVLGKEIRVKEHPDGIDISLGLVVSRGKAVPGIVRELRDRLAAELESTLDNPLRRIHITIRKITRGPNTRKGGSHESVL